MIGRATWRETENDSVSIIAAGTALYAFAALIPLLTAFTLSFGLFADPAPVSPPIGKLTTMLPSDAATIIGDQIEGLSRAGSKTSVALMAALLLTS